MDIVFTHFWLICGLWAGGFGALSFRYKILKGDKFNEISREEVNTFSKGWAYAIILPCTILWLIQMSFGPNSQPFFTDWPSPQKWMALGVIILCWITLLYWVWLGSGANVLSRMTILANPRYPKYLLSPTTFKILSILVIASGIYSLSLEWAKLTS